MPDLPVADVDPRRSEDLARRLLTLQRAAYRVEAALVGSDALPPLHEPLEALRAAPLRWRAVVDPSGDLRGAVATSEVRGVVDLERLVVDPRWARRGVGRLLVTAVLAEAAERGRAVVVSTGRDNVPARALYEACGFREAGEREVASGLVVTSYRWRSAAAST